jgi:hypothetical protein
VRGSQRGRSPTSTWRLRPYPNLSPRTCHDLTQLYSVSGRPNPSPTPKVFDFDMAGRDGDWEKELERVAEGVSLVDIAEVCLRPHPVTALNPNLSQLHPNDRYGPGRAPTPSEETPPSTAAYTRYIPTSYFLYYIYISPVIYIPCWPLTAIHTYSASRRSWVPLLCRRPVCVSQWWEASGRWTCIWPEPA